MMSETKAQLLMLKGAISELTKEQQEAIQACSEKLRAVLAENGEMGTLALALVSLEAAE